MDHVETVEIPMNELTDILKLQISSGSNMVPMLHNGRDWVWLTHDPKRDDVTVPVGK